MDRFKIYANYGILGHEKEILWSVDYPMEEIYDEYTAKIPEGFEAYEGAWGNLCVKTPEGEEFSLRDILAITTEENPLISYYDRNEKKHEISVSLLEEKSINLQDKMDREVWMTKRELEKSAVKIGEYDFHDSYITCAYGGTSTLYYYRGYVYESIHYANMVRYVGKDHTAPLGRFEEVLKLEEDKLDSSTYDLLKDFEKTSNSVKHSGFEIKEMYVADRLPNHYMLELLDGSTKLIYVTPFRKITENDLLPCVVKPKQIGATPVDERTLKCYGLKRGCTKSPKDTKRISKPRTKGI
ncbi:hypothetical protein ACDL92_11865 [Ihubacter sp. mB4P-1]|uniref:hypothetical protein n=1 Tax=Ihubacter sp. mB4P-1 TaxID=3242370 RepID=UPI002173695F|nr:hypothetical protein [Emergencia sp.]